MSSRISRSQTGGIMTEVQYRSILKITEKIAKLPIAEPFLYAVDEKEVPEYSKVISKPIWLERVLERIKSASYTSLDQWKSDMNLIWKNAKKFNGEESAFTAMATELETVFRKRSESIPANEVEEWVSNMRQKQAKYGDIMMHRPMGRGMPSARSV